MFRLSKKAQSTAEYAIVIALVIGAAVGMQVYVRRGLQARMKGAMDYLVNETTDVLGDTAQYEPGITERKIAQEAVNPLKEEVFEGGEVVRTIVGEETMKIVDSSYELEAYEEE